MKRLLFVDDEPRILDGLRRMLRRRRADWSVEFATQAAEALDRVANEEFDAVVTDMTMPVMDGAELLARVSQLKPGTLRFILSGHTDPDVALSAARVAHQFISKPVNPTALQKELDDALRWCDAVPAVTRPLVGGVAVLPSVPQIVESTARALAADEVSLQRVSALAGTDPGLLAKLLQLVNSAFIGLPRNTANVKDAVQYIGLRSLRALCDQGTFVAALRDNDRATADVVTAQRHALSVARIARRIVRRSEQQDAAYAAGLLHGVGEMILANAAAATDGGPACMVGASLLGIWGLPSAVVGAVAYHSDPVAATDEHGELAAAVCLAHTLAEPDETGPRDLDPDLVTRYGWEGDVDRWRHVAAEVLAS